VLSLSLPFFLSLSLSLSFSNTLNRLSLTIYTGEIITYGVATISTLLKTIGLFCRISSLLWGPFAKETYSFKEPTNRSHPIAPKRSVKNEERKRKRKREVAKKSGKK